MNAVNPPSLNSSTLNQQLRLLTVGLALGTACLYTYGLTYHQGSLAYWGLEETMFPLTLERSLFQGFVASSQLGAVALAPLLGVALTVFTALLFFSWIWAQLRNGLGPRQRGGHGPAGTRLDIALPLWLGYAARWVQASYWALVAFVLLMLTLVVADRLGRQAAHERHLSLRGGSLAPVTVTHRLRGPVVGHALICSDTHCAYLVGETVLTLSRADIGVIESQARQTPP